MATATTKADLLARVAELEAQLATSTSDPRDANMTRLVGMLKAVKDITRPDSTKRTVSAILVNSTNDRRNGTEIEVDLPFDSIIATDNGIAIASDILALANNTRWARVAISGYWTTFGEITRNDRGYPVCHRRQLRAMKLEVLNYAPHAEPESFELPFSAEPTSEEVPF